MQELILQVSPPIAQNELALRKIIEEKLDLDVFEFFIKKRSIDARKASIKINLTLVVLENGEHRSVDQSIFINKDVSTGNEIHIVGAGPAGYFAALQAIQLGLKPIIFERGKDVKARRRDLARLNKEHIVNPESNYCFGEGGAGTYSDGKLYTRSKKRGDVLLALQWFVHFGANPDILIDAHPHIGTNLLPKIISEMRETIVSCGGEVRFNEKVTGFEFQQGKVVAVEINGSINVKVDNLILATGHSARDIFKLLFKENIKLEAKGFALGVRIEHSQDLIDQIQYHKSEYISSYLPPASYSLVDQIDGRGVYSFCMCPGGIIAPCATAEGEVVTNGWSPSKRNNPYANSGIVVEIRPEDLPNYSPDNPFICLDFQRKVENDCWKAAGSTQAVPAQRVIDFVNGKLSADFPKTSYHPGIVSVDLSKVLPKMVAVRLQKAFLSFGKKMQGYYTNDAVIHAPESRTSSPVKIPRDEISCAHPEVSNLYPCAEGAGYAGGIVSAAIDGMKCVKAIANKYSNL